MLKKIAIILITILFVLPTLVFAGNPLEGVEAKQVSREEAKDVKGKGRFTRFIRYKYNPNLYKSNPKYRRYRRR